ncbi:unnamed protein product [Protopolystoma xenopodis]|uniref:Uncharacterized protein n=1 Tax=Protopolystoma xenopodis TaxID=117903 RepID=A0A3S5BLP6_9PLAT|nr:unnamed protein product [Protopolystoma xenopodis]
MLERLLFRMKIPDEETHRLMAPEDDGRFRLPCRRLARLTHSKRYPLISDENEVSLYSTYDQHCPSWDLFLKKSEVTCQFDKLMAPLTDDAGETFRNEPSQRSDAGNYEYYNRGHGARYVPQGCAETPTKV